MLLTTSPGAPPHSGLQDTAGISSGVPDPALPSAGTRLKDSLSSREVKPLKILKRSGETAGMCDGCENALKEGEVSQTSELWMPKRMPRNSEAARISAPSSR